MTARNAVIIDETDNVVVAIHELKRGDVVTFPLPGGGEETLVARQDIPLFHKLARTDIAQGERVVKYGEYIGVATRDIRRGDHVHTHNLASTDATKGREATEAGEATSADAPGALETSKKGEARR